MRVTAMLAFFDEPATQLYQCAKSAGRLADHIVAADGPFELYPHTTTKTGKVALHALECGAHDGGATLHLIDGQEWPGQVAKRDAIMQAATGSDWVFYMDADDRIREIDAPSVRGELERTQAEALVVGRYTPPNPKATWKPDANSDEREGGTLYLPRLFRYLQDMRVETFHWGYTGARRNGRRVTLWGPANHFGFPPLCRTQPLVSHLLFEHLQTWRPPEYRERQLAYRAATEKQVAKTGAEA